jgi:hypothetical protein
MEQTMNKKTRFFRAKLLVFTISCLLIPFGLSAQELTRINVTTDEIVNKFIGKSLKGDITGASIVTQAGSGVVIELDFRGYENFAAVSFRAQLMKDGKRVGNLKAEEHSISTADGTIRVAFQLAGLSDGQALESDSLQIAVNKNDRHKHQYTYEFTNSWGFSESAGALVGTVIIEPQKKSGPVQTMQFSRKAIMHVNVQTLSRNQAGVAAAVPPPRNVPANATGNSYIKGAANLKMCFHKRDAGWNNGNPIHLYQCNQGQIGWKTWIYDSSNGYIKNAEKKNKCLHKRSGWKNGTAIHLWDCNGGKLENKSWKYNASTGQISARKNSSKCIHKKFSHWNDNNPLHLWNCNPGGSANERWKFVSTNPLANLPSLPIGEAYELDLGQIPDPEEIDTTPQGTGGQRVELLADVAQTGFEGEDFLGIEVYEDKNPASGVFYYHPLYYSLDWDPDESRYGMDITYGIGEAEKKVQMGMILRSSHLRRHRQFVEKMLKLQYENFTDLLPMPGETQITLPARLSNLFSLSEDDISVPSSPALSEIPISWRTDPVGQENLVAALTGQLGVSGEVILYPNGLDENGRGMPLYANLASRRTFGHIEWNREEGWLNTTAYPIVLKQMHAMKIGSDVSVTTWELGNTPVPSKAQVVWEPSQVPANLLDTFDHVWFDYEVKSCRSCDLAAVATILKDIPDINAKVLNINVLSPIASCNLGVVFLKVRSNYMNPGENSSATVDIQLNDDSQFEQKLYFTDESLSGKIGEYQIRGSLLSGKPLKTDLWYPIEDMVLYVGPYQVEESFPGEVSCE